MQVHHFQLLFYSRLNDTLTVIKLTCTSWVLTVVRYKESGKTFLRAVEGNHGVEQSLEDSSWWVWNGRLGHLRGPEYSKWVEASKRKNAQNESAEVSKTGAAEALEDLC